MCQAAFKNVYAYLFAVLLTLVATLAGWLLQSWMPAANTALIYIGAVIVTAVNTRILPALASAFTGFLAFNFFFTEPRGSLLMTHQEDVLTAALFLLTALLVGSLAARLKGEVKRLESRDNFSRIELQLLEQVSASIGPDEIMQALGSALRQYTGADCVIVRLDVAGRPEWAGLEQTLPESLRNHVLSFVAEGEAKNGIPRDHEFLTRLLSDRNVRLALVLIPAHVLAASRPDMDALDILLRQAGLALGRTRLVADLARERLDKERELLRSSLLSSVSHDFRTPLTAMVGATTTLMDMSDALSPAQQRELLESVLAEAKRLDNYTQNLLDMTRLGQGELKLDRDWVSIEEIVNVVMKRIRPLAQSRRLEVSMGSSLPLLRVHAALIEQAIFNVLHNAIKFSPEQGRIVLSCTQDVEHSAIVLEITDEGPGIPESERDKVFDMFHTAEQGDRRVAGSGLGLAICRGMIGAHGGSVRIGSGPGERGCLVRMLIPVAAMNGEKSREPQS